MAIQKMLKKQGFVIGGYREYHGKLFDSIMHREGGETIYVRMLFHVLKGQLDDWNTLIEFQKPFIIKYVVNVGLDKDANSVMDVTGFTNSRSHWTMMVIYMTRGSGRSSDEEAIGDILNKL